MHLKYRETGLDFDMLSFKQAEQLDPLSLICFQFLISILPNKNDDLSLNI